MTDVTIEAQTDGGVVGSAETERLLNELVAKFPAGGPLLLIPPDITRFHSGAGALAVALAKRWHGEVVVMPALGTHRPMTDVEIGRMFPGLSPSLFRPHDWRNDIQRRGVIDGAEIAAISEGAVDYPVEVAVNKLLFSRPWAAVVSIGQLVPHEVAGIANHSKNVLVGVGGRDFIHKSHFLGAAYGMERIMGVADNPVRRLFQRASQFLSDLPIWYLLTVRERLASGDVVTRGLYAGQGEDCYRRGAELCRAVNMIHLDHPPRKVVVHLDASEFRSTWLGNKSVYRTRLAIADGGELVVLAPGVEEFGEDPGIDAMIRRFGYRGRAETLASAKASPELAGNLSAAAHLMHGSSDGRFTITYCPGHLSREEIESVGYRYGDLAAFERRYDPAILTDGWNRLSDGEEVFYISQPGLGLWSAELR